MTTAQQPRRGLPRRTGEEQWPPAGASTTGETTAEEPALGEPTAHAAGRGTSPAAGNGTATQSAEPAAGPAERSGSAPGGPTQRRRGLPRRPGEGPGVPASEPAVGTTSTAQPAAPASGPAGAPAAGAPRRGLPRPGQEGQPAPTSGSDGTPAGQVARRGVPRPGHAPSAEPGTTGPQAPTAAPGGRRAGLPRPGAPSTPAVDQQSTAAAAEAHASTTSRGAPPPANGGGGAAQRSGAPGRRRYGRYTAGQWAGAALLGIVGLVGGAALIVLLARWLTGTAAVSGFLESYPGKYQLPAAAPTGIPAWAGWQHFFNVFLIVLIIRSGLRVRLEKRPEAYWTPRWNSKQKISLQLWLHQSLDVLWIVNGVVFVVLLFATGHWMRIVPTSWEVFPNAVSAGLQYLSLDWPTESGWVHYNGLQQLAYFTTVFVAAPLAVLSGVRMSGIWPKDAARLNKIYPVEWARAVHFPVMLYFVAFIVGHVAMVFATGALRNLNHMYAAQDAVNWTGFWIFVGSLVVIAAAWVAARPLVLAPIAGLFGRVSTR